MPSLDQTEIFRILNEKKRWITLATIGADGFAHCVPMGYFLADSKIILGCRDHTQKVKNVERNSKVTLLWDNGREEDHLTGIMISGSATVARSDEDRWPLKIEACRQRNEEPPQSLGSGSVYLVIEPIRFRSWHRPRS